MFVGSVRSLDLYSKLCAVVVGGSMHEGLASVTNECDGQTFGKNFFCYLREIKGTLDS